MTRDLRARAAAIVLVLLHAVLAWMFWSAQELPRGFRDEFFIVELATDIAFGGDLRALLLGDYYPPLLRLPGVLALWAGGSYRAMLAAQALLWLPLLALGTWWAARRLTGEWGATLAVALLLLRCQAVWDGQVGVVLPPDSVHREDLAVVRSSWRGDQTPPGAVWFVVVSFVIARDVQFVTSVRSYFQCN